MAYIEKRLVPGSLLTGTAATYYTCLSIKAIIKEMVFCNTDASSAYSFTLYIVPAAGSANDANAEFKTVSLQAKETKRFAITDVMENGSTIQAFADTAAKIAFSASGVERI